MMTIGQRINMIRKEKGLTIQQLADKSDISTHTIISWIYQGHHPDILLLCDLADTLDISLDELVGRQYTAGLDA